jgi:hypothetical protein
LDVSACETLAGLDELVGRVGGMPETLDGGRGGMVVALDDGRGAIVVLVACVGGVAVVGFVEFCVGIGIGVGGSIPVTLLAGGSMGATIGSSVGGNVFDNSATPVGDQISKEDGCMVPSSPIPEVKLLPNWKKSTTG